MKHKIYKKDDNWRLQFIDPVTQKRRRKSFKTKRDAEVYLDEFRTNTAESALSKLTLKRHLEDYNSTSERNTKISNGNLFYKSFIQKFGDYKAHELTFGEIGAWIDEYQEKRKLKRKTMYEYKSHLHPLFRYLELIRVIEKSPLDHYTYNKLPEIKRSKYTPEYMEALFYYSPYLLWRLVWLEKETGLSRKAICNLKWTDDMSEFDSHVKLFIGLLPRRCEYVLGNYKAKKIDYNLVFRRLREFEEKFFLL